ncbi:MAG: efflux RND transporter periplasmic adaptor subunit [Paracoccaceae bacterium]|nr:efflux RND transporter periplasmic adaptor subunit [Paracoccaceae bacterium]
MTDHTDASATPETLAFTSDRGSSRSFWFALLLTLLIVGWMGSGFIIPSEAEEETVARGAPEPVAVSVRTSRAKPVTQFFQAEGQALPDRDTPIRAESSGQIAEVLVGKGQDVERGAAIARFETTEREANLARAQAEIERAQREFDNATALRERGVATADRVSQAEAALAAAQAALATAEEDLRNTTIVAPFAGRIETLDIDEGEFIQSGGEVGRIVDNAPLTIEIQVPQQSLRQLQNGQPARVQFITGEERAGAVTFVGTSASSDTRTFLVEIDVPNRDRLIPAGVSAEIQIPVGQVEAHFLSPSILSLDPGGALGVKTVDENDTVKFYPIEVVRAQINGIWVNGLPEDADVIVVGQGYVNDGEVVRPQHDGGASQ